jgi:hypothetical protein
MLMICQDSSAVKPNKGVLVAHYTKKRHDVASYLSTSEKNKGLSKERKMKMSPFYVGGDRKAGSGTSRVTPTNLQ